MQYPYDLHKIQVDNATCSISLKRDVSCHLRPAPSLGHLLVFQNLKTFALCCILLDKIASKPIGYLPQFMYVFCGLVILF